jgi:hypothetical protein
MTWTDVDRWIGDMYITEPPADYERPSRHAIWTMTECWYFLKDTGTRTPDGGFLMPDGGAMWEWRCEGGKTLCLDFAPSGLVQVVTTYPGQDATFTPVTAESVADVLTKELR